MGRRMIPMRTVWTRVPSVTAYDGVSPSIAKAVDDFDTALRAAPDSREKHRALVQALSYAGDIPRARDLAQRWLDRDRLDPQALGYEADLLGRDGQRDLGLRTLSGLVDLAPDRADLHERLVRAYESVGRMGQACGHRISLATLAPKDLSASAAAVRCLRSLGRDGDARIVLGEMPDAQRAQIEKAATAAAIPPRTDGELAIAAHWAGGADLDLSIVTPDGTRISWMGGKPDAVVTDATSTERETLTARSIKKGNYLIEIARGTPSTGVVRGSVDVTVLGLKRTLPFELSGERVVVGRLSIGLESHLEEAWDLFE
jgi:tetratricopeptide (TPR) repeat protein